MKSLLLKQLACLLIFIFLLLPKALASDLYVGETTLDDSGQVTDAALLRALDEVLIRLTGKVGESPVRQLQLGATDLRMLVQSQQIARISKTDETGEREDMLRLRAEFDAPSIDRLLIDRGLPRWGRERPTILLWIAQEGEEGVELRASDHLADRLSDQARQYGLDVLLPLGDAMDLAEVAAADVRGGFLDAAEPGSRRYGARVVAMLDIRPDGDRWSGRWFWRIEGRDHSHALTADAPAELIDAGLRAMFQGLATRYAIRAGSEGGWRQVTVSGIVDAVQYGAVLNYLENLSVVDQLRVVAAREREVSFDLLLLSGGLEDVLAVGGLLRVGEQRPDGRLQLYFQQ